MRLKLSQFVVPLHDYPTPGNHLLYNTLTRALIQIDDGGWSLLNGLPEVPSHEKVREWLTALGKEGFVVPEGVHEGELYIQRLERSRGNTDRLSVTLSLIQSCNFACGYCYQGGNSTTHNRSRITKEGQSGNVRTDEIVAFLKSQCEDRKVKALAFTAHGGEPLLNKSALLEIAEAMSAYCQQKRIQWHFGMVSNGSLLNRKTVAELKQFGFDSVQVTIDGNRETHDASRPWKNAKSKSVGTYDVIMRNLEGWVGQIDTEILCVVSPSNIDAAHELIDTLAEKGYAKKGVRISFSPISPTYDDTTLVQLAQNYAENPELLKAELEMDEVIAKLIIHAAEHGLVDDVRPRVTWCAAIRANGQNITVSPDGKIYSCALFLGRDEKYETGHISQHERGGLDTVMQAFEYPDNCKSCTYLPICSNCRADALSKTGDIEGASSQKGRYDLMLPQLIKAHHRLLNQQKAHRETAP